MCEFTQTGGKKDEEKRDFKTGIPEGQRGGRRIAGSTGFVERVWRNGGETAGSDADGQAGIHIGKLAGPVAADTGRRH